MLRPVPQRLTTTSSSAETTPDGVVSLEEKRGAQVLVINWFSFLPIENFHSEIDWFLLKGSVNFFFFFFASSFHLWENCARQKRWSQSQSTHILILTKLKNIARVNCYVWRNNVLEKSQSTYTLTKMSSRIEGKQNLYLIVYSFAPPFLFFCVSKELEFLTCHGILQLGLWKLKWKLKGFGWWLVNLSSGFLSFSSVSVVNAVIGEGDHSEDWLLISFYLKLRFRV